MNLNENSLTDMLEQWRDLLTEMSPALHRLGQLEVAIKRSVVATGETAEIEGAAVTIRPGYDRVTYDTKALEGYALAHPEILELRTTTTTKPSVILSPSLAATISKKT